jgi:hypothetical protein
MRIRNTADDTFRVVSVTDPDPYHFAGSGPETFLVETDSNPTFYLGQFEGTFN